MFEMVFYRRGLGKYLLCKMNITFTFTFTLRVLWGYIPARGEVLRRRTGHECEAIRGDSSNLDVS